MARAWRAGVKEFAFVALWVNRGTRRRHVNPDCQGLARAREFDAYYEEEGSGVRDRIYELDDDTAADVIAAVETFTVPCKLCVPGARELGKLMPFGFVDEGYEELD